LIPVPRRPKRLIAANSGTAVPGPWDLLPYADRLEFEDDDGRPDSEREEIAVEPDDPNTAGFDELRIVVGVDGSASAARAVEVAVMEAARWGVVAREEIL
jgi:hypothetical protein